mmetsp:Transcript_81210/g.188642  ORF Transcript_81210/g.188642 Transcript_81210/m.188642 type:complete len:266 (+) Transcript_81210:966-1763(+)
MIVEEEAVGAFLDSLLTQVVEASKEPCCDERVEAGLVRVRSFRHTAVTLCCTWVEACGVAATHACKPRLHICKEVQQLAPAEAERPKALEQQSSVIDTREALPYELGQLPSARQLPPLEASQQEEDIQWSMHHQRQPSCTQSFPQAQQARRSWQLLCLRVLRALGLLFPADVAHTITDPCVKVQTVIRIEAHGGGGACKTPCRWEHEEAEGLALELLAVLLSADQGEAQLDWRISLRNPAQLVLTFCWRVPSAVWLPFEADACEL